MIEVAGFTIEPLCDSLDVISALADRVLLSGYSCEDNSRRIVSAFEGTDAMI